VTDLLSKESVLDGGSTTHYLRYTRKKKLILFALITLTAGLALYAINAGSAELSPLQVILTLLGQVEGNSQIIIWSIRLPRVLAAMLTTMIILFLAKYKGVSPESMVLAGVALGSLFSAGTMLLQYFTNDVNVASVVFWTFGDIGRASWSGLGIMSVVIFGSMFFFLYNRWNYNAIDSGEETAKGLGVDVERTRLWGMFCASLITATVVSFLGIIAFIGLVAPHLIKRLIGGDNRFLVPASGVMGALLLLAADTLARRIIAPVILPVGAVTSFLGAPLFLYLLVKGSKLR
jgi:iron complex transport system permease protein